jgi:hypothetical protein
VIEDFKSPAVAESREWPRAISVLAMHTEIVIRSEERDAEAVASGPGYQA